MLFEDPMYDEDGVIVDEDADWEDIDTGPIGEFFSPYATVNS